LGAAVGARIEPFARDGGVVGALIGRERGGDTRGDERTGGRTETAGGRGASGPRIETGREMGMDSWVPMRVATTRDDGVDDADGDGTSADMDRETPLLMLLLTTEAEAAGGAGDVFGFVCFRSHSSRAASFTPVWCLGHSRSECPFFPHA